MNHQDPLMPGSPARSVSRLFLLTLFTLGAMYPTSAWAHDPGLSIATAQITNGGLSIQLGMARNDVERLVTPDANRGGQVNDSQFQAALSRLREIAGEALAVSCGDRSLRAMRATAELDKQDGIRLELEFPKVGFGPLTIRSLLLEKFPRGHRQFLSVRDEQGTLSGEQMLDASHNELTVQIVCKPQASGNGHLFRQFVPLGVTHILTGYDHLLFLFGLLLVGGSLRSAVQTITSFTFAHSITLALAALNVINISPRIIEPLIAASIVYVGVDNVLRPELKGRWVLTFGFGLIHGCGFASALRELGLGANGSSVVLPLVSFNLGVEVGQMTIAALVLPLIWRCRRSPAFVKRLTPIGSCLIALTGGYWLLQRTLF
jgi:hydrogenase/urease accessory protein HupE